MHLCTVTLRLDFPLFNGLTSFLRSLFSGAQYLVECGLASDQVSL